MRFDDRCRLPSRRRPMPGRRRGTALQDRAAALGADVRFGTGPAALADDRRPVSRSTSAARPSGAGRRRHRRRVGPRGRSAVGTRRAGREGDAGADAALRSRGSDGDWPSFIHHRQPWVYGLLAPGEGVKVAEHHVGPVVDPDHRPRRDRDAEAAVVRYVEQWFPGLDPTPLRSPSASTRRRPDESFVLERRGPIVIGSPCSGHGFKFTPLIGTPPRRPRLSLSARGQADSTRRRAMTLRQSVSSAPSKIDSTRASTK